MGKIVDKNNKAHFEGLSSHNFFILTAPSRNFLLKIVKIKSYVHKTKIVCLLTRHCKKELHEVSSLEGPSDASPYVPPAPCPCLFPISLQLIYGTNFSQVESFKESRVWGLMILY